MRLARSLSSPGTQAARIVARLHVRCLATRPAVQQASPEVVQTEGIPVLLYAPKAEVEPEALKQLVKLAESGLPVGHVAAMPDVHLGKGVTIGTVFASEDYVCPNAVGVDIGCGMSAVPVAGLYKDRLRRQDMLRIQERIKQSIPTGFNSHKRPLHKAREVLDDISQAKPPSRFLEEAADQKKVALQLGTLGGGNHFLEVVYDELTEQVYLMLHSGSRGIGNNTAQHHDKQAQQDMQQRGTSAATPGLNYLHIRSPEGAAYLQDMDWCQDYAMNNRRMMMHLLAEAVEDVTGCSPDMGASVNIHHNYCQCEDCSWQDHETKEDRQGKLWVTRKGATSARKGQAGIVPGSMGTGSFLTVGKGNADSWNSCSHGAGRAMSRTRAKAVIKQADFEASMASVVCDMDSRVRDEAPAAYKDITKVMAAQTDLLDIKARLLPLINVKGF